MALTQDIVNFVNRSLSRAMAPLKTLARIASVSGASSTGPRVTADASVSTFESHKAVEVLEAYGFTSHPPSGSQGLLLCLGGDGAHPVLLQVGNPGTRLAGLASGEVAIHVGNAEGTGARVVCRVNGDLELQPGPLGVVRMGAAAPAPAPAVARLGDSVAVTSAGLLALQEAFDTWVPVANDGGTALKTALAAFLGLDEAVVQAGVGTITSGGTGAVST